MRRTPELVLVAALAVSLLGGCAHLNPPHPDIEAGAVQSEAFDPEAVRTFAWAGSLAALKDETGAWAAPGFEIKGELEYLIERELRARGIVPVLEDPDVFVTYAVVLAVPEPTPEEIEAGMVLDDLSKGAILVELADGETLEPLWRGAAAGSGASESSDEVRRERLDVAISALFDDYPGCGCR